MQRRKIATYYARLKVAPDAPPEVVRAAYKALVQKYHPDRHQGSVRHEIVLSALNKAQDVLLDPQRRAAHDQWIRDEEVRLGWREPQEDAPPGSDHLGLGLRLELAMASVRHEGMGWAGALRLHLTRGQRLGLALGATLLMALVAMLLAGALKLMLFDDDSGLNGLTPALDLSAAQGSPVAAAPGSR